MLEATQAMSAAGRGREAFYITLCCTDALSVRYVAARERLKKYEKERERRVKNHGTLKPIPVH